ncbi:hypothetical protein ACSNO4_00180 [Kocuria flava]|uniref:hypothetical protein n=1 Tax=Kocuria flava TaxID=446860 RepID=UPI003F1D1635
MSGTFHDEYTAADPQAVTDLFAQLGVRFAFDTAGPGLAYREARAGDEGLSIARLTMGQAFSTWGDTEVFGVADVRGPRYDWHTGDEDGTVGSPVLFRPGHPALVVAGPLEATNVYATPARLQEVAETVYDTREPVAFGSSRPTSTRLGALWSSLVRAAVAAVDFGTFAEPLVRADLSRHLGVGMLECFALLGDSHERTLSMAAQSRRYRIARQFLDDHAHLPVAVEDAARAAGTTTPALVRAFRANHASGGPRPRTCAGPGSPAPTPSCWPPTLRGGTPSGPSPPGEASPTPAGSPAPTARPTGSPRASPSAGEASDGTDGAARRPQHRTLRARSARQRGYPSVRAADVLARAAGA